MTDADAVLAANAAFYQAVEHLELAAMEAVPLRAPYIRRVHPGWGLLVVHHHGSPIYGPVAGPEQVH